MADQTLREGAVFHEKYQVIRSLAQGGMGAVYEVIHLETNRRRALKVMLPSVLGSEELRNRFRAEARVASGIESEHIVETFDAGIDRASGMPFLVMELLKGQELADVLKSQGAFPPDRALPLIAQVSRTLDKTHAARVVHRDLKPENLFVSTREDGTLHVKILDFGIAKVVAEGQNAGQTRSLGTPLYMAPEQFDGSAPISAQTDLFALAHITYTMLVGVPYWAEEMESSPSLYGFLMAMQNPDSEPPTQRAARRRAQLPPGFDAWFARATAKRAQDPLSQRRRAAGRPRAGVRRGGPGLGSSRLRPGHGRRRPDRLHGPRHAGRWLPAVRPDGRRRRAPGLQPDRRRRSTARLPDRRGRGTARLPDRRRRASGARRRGRPPR
jgi:serine/threonine protein kinase